MCDGASAASRRSAAAREQLADRRVGPHVVDRVAVPVGVGLVHGGVEVRQPDLDVGHVELGRSAPGSSRGTRAPRGLLLAVGEGRRGDRDLGLALEVTVEISISSIVRGTSRPTSRAQAKTSSIASSR